MNPTPELDCLREVAPEVAGIRTPESPIPPVFLNRWSPRSFLSDPVSKGDLMACFEAARWAPSAFNEQPWRFLYAVAEKDRKKFLECLLPFNRAWASGAPVLLALCAKEAFSHDGSSNGSHALDAGAAWMAFALEARRRGFHTHAMGGFVVQEAVRLLSVPEGFRPLCFIAMGRRGPADALPEEARKRETPSSRKPVTEIAMEGGFPL
jgi:nitroreductase